MAHFHSNALIGASGGQGGAYKIERSLRFNSGDSAYLNRTPSSAGNRKTWTWSGWVKRCADPSNHTALFTAGTTVSDTGFFRITFHANGHINVATGATNILYDGGKLRDFSAWYHILVSVDTTASSNQVKCYVNGALYQQATAISNVDTAINSTLQHQIGRDTGETTHADIYLAEVHFIDGQALAASDFGEYDSNNVWQPKEFAGSYTTSGVSFDFAEQELYAGGTREALFDGSTSTGCNFRRTTGSGGDPSNTKRIKVTFPTAKTGVTKLRIYGGGNTSSTNKVWYNDDVSTMIDNDDPVGWKTVYTGSAITINSISFGTSVGGSNLRAIEINDTILTDDIEHGLNSFYLKFDDNSSAAALGTDSSGQSNTWTVNNLSVASGAGNDSLIDTPSNYDASSGNNGGNYCTLNPLKNQSQTLKNGNLESNGTSGRSTGTLYASSGKFYWEFTAGSSYTMAGIESRTSPYSASYPGENDQQYAVYGNNGSGQLYHNNSATSFDGFVSGDVIGVALDMDAGNLYFYKNGSAMNSGNAAATGLTGAWTANCRSGSGAFNGDTVFNFGQRPFAHTPPTGYVSLCTQNLSDPTITDTTTVFDTKLYTGTGSNFTVTYDFSPDFAWIKGRSYTSNGQLSDTIRSSAGNKRFELPTGNAEDAGGPTFVSTGLSLGTNAAINTNNQTYVSWAWDAGSSTVSNTDGSITSSIRVNASAGFSIVTWSGNSQNATVGHGLGAVPQMIIHKRRNGAASFITYHIGTGATNALQFNAGDALINNSYFDNKSPTSTIFNVSDFDETNRTGNNYVAYCWTPIEGYSSFGSYTGNGSTDGPFVATGMRPKFLIIKCSTLSGEDWLVLDTARDPFNVADGAIYASQTHAENSTSLVATDILSNGFKVRTTNGVSNSNGQTYVYMAFAEHPFKTARAR